MIAFKGATIAFALLLFTLFATHGKAEEPALTPDDIYIAQTILFENGFTQVGFPDGIVGHKTRDAVRNWQMQHQLEATGDLDKATIDALIKAGFPKDFIWGAVSISYDGEVVAVTQYRSGVQAYRDAKNACEVLSPLSLRCITVAIYTLEPMETWLAGYYCLDEHSEPYVTIAPGADQYHAKRLAYQGIIEETEFEPWECELGASIAVNRDYGTTPASMQRVLRDEETH